MPTTPTPAARRRSSKFTTAIIALGASLALPLGALAQSLQSRLDMVIADSRIGATKLGVHIVNCRTGSAMASRDADRPLIPASNMKLITSGAALATLGPEYVFKTELLYLPAVEGRPEQVILRGSGDPALGDGKLLEAMGMKADDIIDAWADAIKQAGAKRPEIIVDDRVFDRQFVHPTWPTDQLNRWYCCEVSGLNYHANLLAIYTTPREPGRPPRLALEPSAPWLQIANKAKSVNSGQHTVWVARTPEANSFILSGDARYAADPVEVSLQNVPELVARLIGDRLADDGIKAAGTRVARAEEDFSGASVIHLIQTPMARVLERCNKDSYNLYAECLLKAMGRAVTGAPGSWQNGATVARMVLLDKLGPAAGQSITVADGSGMSRENRVTARMLAAWLHALQSDTRIAPAFLDSLAQAGKEGTLRRRFREHKIDLKNEVRAKTGYISGVSSLSGYVTSPDGSQRVAFSIIANDKPNHVTLNAIWHVQEEIVEVIDKWITRQSQPATGAAGGN